MKPSLTRLELAAVAILFAIGVSMRAAAPSWMAVEHFDEGVYASNLYSPLTGNRYPDQHLYAPPLLPFLLEWAAIFGGPHAVMWVNVVAGSLTLLVVWGMVRSWWGPPSAIAALTLLAFNEFHIAYSRAALTDALLCLWLTAGVWAGWRAVMTGGTLNVLAAGGLAGLAWWTKYNGWLTLAITGAGTAGWVLWGRLASGRGEPAEGPSPASGVEGSGTLSGGLRPPLAEPSGVHLLRWAATALVAFLVWSPWLWQLQQYGGYAAVAKNHAGYFAGLSEWIPNAIRQLAGLRHEFGAWTAKSLLDATAFVACFSALTWKWRRSECTLAGNSNGRALGFWTATAWLLGLTVAIPLYRPYPRLALPWVIAVSIALSGLAGRLFGPRRPLKGAEHADRSSGASNTRAPKALMWLSVIAMTGGVAAWLTGLPSLRSSTWGDRTSLRKVAEATITRLKSERLDRPFEGYRCAIYVLAEPGLFFHLSAAQPWSPIDHLTQAASEYGMAQPGGHGAPVPAYLLTGPHADAEEADRLVAAGRLTQIAEFAYHPSDLVLLDEYPVWELETLPKPVTQRVRLFQVKTD